MRGFKQHKKMYKSGKFWVVAGLAVVSLITANDTSKVLTYLAIDWGVFLQPKQTLRRPLIR